MIVSVPVRCRFSLQCCATRENRSLGFPTRCNTNSAVQSQKQARSLKFQIKEEEILYYQCSENKGADQLRSYCEADLRLCFRIGKNPVFSRCGSICKRAFARISLCMFSEKHDDVFRLFFLNVTGTTKISSQGYIMWHLFVAVLSALIVCKYVV